MAYDFHLLATCPTCGEEVTSRFPDRNYKLKTTPCSDCEKPLCIGECRSQARRCESPDCGSLICVDCLDGRTGEDVYCAACLAKHDATEQRIRAVIAATASAYLLERDPSGVYL